MPTDKKLILAVVILAGLGAALYFQSKKEKEEALTYSAEGRSAELPKLTFTDEDTKKIDKITITQPAGDAGKAPEVELEKKGESWEVTKPIAARASETNVKSLVDNLKTLKVTELIDPGKDAYAKHGVADDKAVHAVFHKGKDVAAEFWFGDGGSRGQMTRIAGRDGVYAVKGYSSYLYSRDLKGWRDLTIFKFEDKDAESVEVSNESGIFSFALANDAWTGKHKAPKALAAKDIERFDPEKVKDLLRAYKSLNAADFAEGKSLADTGLDKPGAKVTIKMKGGAATHVLEVGGTAEGSNRWVKRNGSDQIFSISSWSADWATAKPEKFQKPEDKKKDDKKGEKDDAEDEEGASDAKTDAKKAPPAKKPAGTGKK
jgi:hypothetical protein